MDYKKTIKRFIKYNNKNGVKNYYFNLILLPKKQYYIEILYYKK